MLNLLWFFFIPFAASLALFFSSRIPPKALKKFAFFLSLIPLAYLLYGGTGWIGSDLSYAWFTPASIQLHLHVDSLSFLFLALTVALVPISILAVKSSKLTTPHVFYGLVLLLEGLLIGFFTAKDLALFTIFWESMLLPLYFIITLWGGNQRQQSALKFLIYMFAGSVLMVAAVLALYFQSAAAGAATFNIDQLAAVSGISSYSNWLFLIFLLAFAVKIPLFPFHGWLPDAYYQAPVAGTILLSALLSKAGIYGIIRIGMGLFPQQLQEWSPFLLGLGIVGVFYGGFAAWRQQDYKRLIAYSSFSHVNFILIGLFVWNQTAHSGAILQALNHGITITALFLVAGWLEERIGTTAMGSIGGLARFMPHLCWLTLFFILSSVALPGTNNFIGEFMILLGLFATYPWATSFLCLSVILSVIYMLRWMQKVYFEPPSFFQEAWIDIRSREFLIAAPLIALVLWIGIYPASVLQEVTRASQTIISIANAEKTQ